MNKLILAGLMAATLSAPALARDDWRGGRGEYHQDRRGGLDRDDLRRGYRPGNDARWDGARYHGWAYRHPRGYAYRSWGVGIRLPAPYLGRPYWIGNPVYYRLPVAGYGARWIRVGPDALLVRIGDGFVIRAVRGLYR